MTKALVEDRDRKIPRHLCCDICEIERANFRIQVTDMVGAVLDSCKVCQDCAYLVSLEAIGDGLNIITEGGKE